MDGKYRPWKIGKSKEAIGTKVSKITKNKENMEIGELTGADHLQIIYKWE